MILSAKGKEMTINMEGTKLDSVTAWNGCGITIDTTIRAL